MAVGADGNGAEGAGNAISRRETAARRRPANRRGSAAEETVPTFDGVDIQLPENYLFRILI